MQYREPSWALIVGLALAAAASGCSSSQPIQTRFMSQNAKLRATASEMRMMVRDLARPFGGVLEETADAIIADTDDLALREAAVRWKINVIPAMHEALFRRDPLEAVLDAGTLLMQIKLHFETMWADDLSQEQLDLVYSAIASMRRDLENVIIRAGGDPSTQARSWELLERWARENPIELSFASRRSTVSELAEFTAVTQTGALSSVSAIKENVDDLMARIDVYSEALTKQARWQAELLLIENLDQGGAITAAIETPPIPIRLASLPIDFAAERDLILAGVRDEHELLQSWVRVERLDMQRWVSSERDEAISALTAERVAVLDALGIERELVLAAVRGEREAVIEDLDRIVAESFVKARTEVVDRALDRLSRLVFLVLGLVFLGAAALMVLWRWLGGAR